MFDEACEEFPNWSQVQKLLDYRNDNFQKASKLPPIRSPTKMSSTPRLMGSSLTARIVMSKLDSASLGSMFKVFEADPHTSTNSWGGAPQQLS